MNNTNHSILDLSMEGNDAQAHTVRAYLKTLLLLLWEDPESFNGKRPFGDSGWEHDLFDTLLRNRIISGHIDEDGDVREIDEETAHKLIKNAIKDL